MMTSGSRNYPPEISYEQILFLALVNEKKHTRLLQSKRQPFTYNEKQLRDEAAAEVASMIQQEELVDRENVAKKRKKDAIEDKSRLSRDKNREHARNTRLRKKIFLQKLQDLCENLTAQRNKEIEDRLALGKRIYQTQELRMETVRNFLIFRAANVQDYSKLSLLLDESFTMTLPITPYMPFNKAEVVNSQRVITGINSYMADVAALAMMVETVGFGTPSWIEALLTDQGCRIWYEIGDKGDIIPAADIVMCRFFMRTEGHERVGAPTSLAKHGMLRCRFNTKNKIVSAEMSFDVMSFMQQYQRSALLTTESSIIPNTFEMVMQLTTEARLVAELNPPYRVSFVNHPWWFLRGFGNHSAESPPKYENKTLEEVLLMQQQSVQSHHRELVTAIISCIPQICRGIPTRIHWIYSSPGSGSPVLAYLKIVPIANELLDIPQFLLIMYEIKLPPHIAMNPFTILSQPVVNPDVYLHNSTNTLGNLSEIPHPSSLSTSSTSSSSTFSPAASNSSSSFIQQKSTTNEWGIPFGFDYNTSSTSTLTSTSLANQTTRNGAEVNYLYFTEVPELDLTEWRSDPTRLQQTKK